MGQKLDGVTYHGFNGKVSLGHICFRRGTVLADKPFASGPTNTFNASSISPLDTPFKYSHGNAASRDFVLRIYGGTRADRNVTGSPVLERTYGILTVTGPKPACNPRSGK